MELVETVFTCALTRWSPGLGDNHPVGWFTVLVYLVAGLVAARAALATIGGGPAARERRFWWIASAILLFLAVNKQLDLQSLLTAVARCHASLAGWYDDRRDVQRAFIWLVAGGGLLFVVLLALLLRGILHRIWLALAGLAFVCSFVVLRAASFHQMDGLIGRTVMGLRLNWLLELSGPILVLVVAWRHSRAARRP